MFRKKIELLCKKYPYQGIELTQTVAFNFEREGLIKDQAYEDFVNYCESVDTLDPYEREAAGSVYDEALANYHKIAEEISFKYFKKQLGGDKNENGFYD